jgi:ABC-type lipoprotein export system ATPase subunit
MELILSLNREQGVTVIIVTHDPQIGELTDRVLTLKDGLLEMPA